MILNSIGILLYLGTAGLCCAAAFMQGVLQRHTLLWLSAAFVFTAMALSRFFGFEQLVRDHLRKDFAAVGAYDSRWDIQIPATLAIIVAGIAVLVFFTRALKRAQGRRERLLFLGVGCAAAYLPLFALRIVSLHATDVLLFYGPLPLNWILDGLLWLGCTVCAAEYMRRHSSKTKAPKQK